MARLGSLSFLFAFLTLLISPFSPAAGVAAPSSTHTREAGGDATLTNETVPDTSLGENVTFFLAQEEAPGAQASGDVQLRGKDRKAPSVRNWIASGLALLVLPLLAMLVDSGYILSKVEDLQEEKPDMTDLEAYEKVLSANTPAAVLSGILAFLAVAMGVNFAVQTGRLLVNMKRHRDQEAFEKQFADMK